MRVNLALSLLALLGASEAVGAERAKPRIDIERQEKRLIIQARAPGKEEWHPVATYNMGDGVRAYLHPVYDASGRQVLTQDRPDDHPWQHGIFTGFHRVNGLNYWKEDEGRQRFVRLLDLKEEPQQVEWTALTELFTPAGEVVLEEENTIAIHAPDSAESYLMDFTLLLRAKEKEVQFGKFFVGGISVRMPWNKADPRQTHLNSEGIKGRAGEQKRAAWCTVEQPFGDEVYGIAVFDHPENENHPPAWRVDEQGLINPNVSGLGDWSLAPGQERRFRYRLYFYRGAADAKRIEAEFKRFAKTGGTAGQ